MYRILLALACVAALLALGTSVISALVDRSDIDKQSGQTAALNHEQDVEKKQIAQLNHEQDVEKKQIAHLETEVKGSPAIATSRHPSGTLAASPDERFARAYFQPIALLTHGRQPGCMCRSERRVWDSNPREHSRALTVFKTVALGH